MLDSLILSPKSFAYGDCRYKIIHKDGAKIQGNLGCVKRFEPTYTNCQSGKLIRRYYSEQKLPLTENAHKVKSNH